MCVSLRQRLVSVLMSGALVVTGAVGIVGIQDAMPTGVGLVEQALASNAEARSVTGSGWYIIDVDWGKMRGHDSILYAESLQKLKSSKGLRSGHMGSREFMWLCSRTYLSGAYKFKLPKRIPYGRFKISKNDYRSFSKTKSLTRAKFLKAIKKKPVYMVWAKVKSGKIIKAYWMSLASAEQLD